MVPGTQYPGPPHQKFKNVTEESGPGRIISGGEGPRDPEMRIWAAGARMLLNLHFSIKKYYLVTF